MKSASKDRVALFPASRTDPRSGVRREISFLPNRGSGIFMCVHLPLGRPSTAVVICSPIGPESMRNDRRESRLADELAARGLCAVRFHYRGTGHSDGSPEALSIDTMQEDAGFVADRIVSAVGATSLEFVGSRLGGFVAAAAASETRAPSIALWEPVVNTRRYFREVVRARIMSDLGKGEARAGASEALFDELGRSGSIDVLGYPINRALYESALERSITLGSGDAPRRILLIQFGASRGVRDEYQQMANGGKESGRSVEIEALGTVEAWWFVRERWELERSQEWEQTLIEHTASWLAVDWDEGAR